MAPVVLIKTAVVPALKANAHWILPLLKEACTKENMQAAMDFFNKNKKNKCELKNNAFYVNGQKVLELNKTPEDMKDIEELERELNQTLKSTKNRAPVAVTFGKSSEEVDHEFLNYKDNLIYTNVTQVRNLVQYSNISVGMIHLKFDSNELTDLPLSVAISDEPKKPEITDLRRGKQTEAAVSLEKEDASFKEEEESEIKAVGQRDFEWAKKEMLEIVNDIADKLEEMYKIFVDSIFEDENEEGVYILKLAITDR